MHFSKGLWFPFDVVIVNGAVFPYMYQKYQARKIIESVFDIINFGLKRIRIHALTVKKCFNKDTFTFSQQKMLINYYQQNVSWKKVLCIITNAFQTGIPSELL